MRFDFLLGVLGFLVVFLTLIGGIAAADVCHRLFTRNLDFFYMIWLWIGQIPFWWIASRGLLTEPVDHPALTYILILPALLLGDFLLATVGPANPLTIPLIAISVSLYWGVAGILRRPSTASQST